jgi:hypothetical protein
MLNDVPEEYVFSIFSVEAGFLIVVFFYAKDGDDRK